MFSVLVCLTAAAPPHILFIVSDDLGFNDVSFHGSNQIGTPFIDAIAADGISLLNYHVQPVCSPTRASIMSGRHVIHTGIYSPFSQATALRLNLSYTLLPSYLKTCCGYSTHAVGKWHLGQNVLAALPSGRGFDTFYGYWSGAEDYYSHSIKGAYDFNDDVRHAPGKTAEDIALRPALELQSVYSTEAMTARAVSIVEQYDASNASAKPLFLYLPYQAVHWPLQAPPRYVALYANKTGGNHARQMLCAMAKCMDDGIGNITRAMKSKAMWENTVVIFTSDNGGPTNNNEGSWSSNFPLRGGKNTLWEGGTRVVGAIRGPGIPSGTVSYEKMHATDWLPTLVSMATGGGDWRKWIPASEPPYAPGDGVNNWPMLQAGGAKGSSARDWLLYETHPENTESNHGDAFVLGDFKIIRTSSTNPSDENGWHVPPGEDANATTYAIARRCGGAAALQRGNAGSVAGGTCHFPKWCLFNVAVDACEYSDLAGARPKDVARLVRALAAYQATAVPPVEPKGCMPVQVNNSVWGKHANGASWQPCDGPYSPKAGAAHPRV